MNRFESNIIIEILICFKLFRWIIGGTWRLYHFGQGLPPINLFSIWTRETEYMPEDFVLLHKETYSTWDERIKKLKSIFTDP